jgi:hypothetical protein
MMSWSLTRPMGLMADLEATRIWARHYATFLHRSGNEQLDGSPPQIST